MAGKRKASKRKSQPKDPLEKKPKVEEDTATASSPIEEEEADDSKFIGEPVPDEEARNRWPHRYPQDAKGKREGTSAQCLIGDGTGDIILAKQHYSMAEVDGILYKLDDDAHVKAEEGKKDYICRIVEMFVARDDTYHFTAQWYYRASDTVITTSSNLIDEKRVFFSEVRDDNVLSSLVRKLVIGRLPLHVDASVRNAAICTCNYYCDMMYLIPYASFVNLPSENVETITDSNSTISDELEGEMGGVNSDTKEIPYVESSKRMEMNLLDLYSGCGAMSTGLCLGAATSGVNLVTKWAVDINPDACRSLKYNHPHMEVRNETAEDFLHLLKEWKRLCLSLNLIGFEDFQQDVHDRANDGDRHEVENDSEVFEVEKITAISYGDPTNKKAKCGLYFKIRWRGYGEEDDTWEPYDGLSDCQDKVKEFVSNGLKSKILPLPGSVDVICGGPPCQGISGFNRFRNKASPLDDPKNHQLVVFMDIVEFLKPRFVLMENVVDIVRFSGGYLGRYALGRLVGMNYQARLGMMVAGAYGLPQFRMRVFMWGALPTENLPQYPLPTHNVVVRGNIPQEFESCCVAHEAENRPELEKELVLKDAIFDLPPVANDEERDDMPYTDKPMTDFQKFIRLQKDELLSSSSTSGIAECVLFDHRPLKLNNDDYLRVLQIPKKKGANYRDLEGIKINSDNVAEFDPDKERVLLPSGKPLVPDYAVKFINGTSSKPFGRLWWDETVPTVVTRAEPHNQVILHPTQDRVLTVRENARLQGFPDYYKLFGTIKERYIQVGNAVAIPVSRALGYALALAVQKSSDGGPLLTLPRNFPNHNLGHAPTIETDA